MKKMTKRKHYTLIHDPIKYVTEGVSPTPAALLDRLRAKELSAIESLSTGRGCVADWSNVVDMLNIAETLAGQGVGPEVLDVCKAAQDELASTAKRYQATSHMGLTGLGLAAVRELFAWHDAQRTAISRGQYEAAIELTRQRIRTHVGNVVDISQI